MRLHANAKLSVKGRELLIDRVQVAGWSLTQAAEAAGVSDRTARKWLSPTAPRGPRAWLIDPQLRRVSPTAPRNAASKRSPRCAGCG